MTEQVWRQRRRKCATCPFIGGVPNAEGADIEVDGEPLTMEQIADDDKRKWPCHEDDHYGELGIECRGHADARRMIAKRRRTLAAGRK